MSKSSDLAGDSLSEVMCTTEGATYALNRFSTPLGQGTVPRADDAIWNTVDSLRDTPDAALLGIGTRLLQLLLRSQFSVSPVTYT